MPDIAANVIAGLTGVGFQPASPPLVVDGIPRRRYVKTILHAGKFIKEPPGQTFEIGPADLANFVAQFARMRENGVAVPIPSTHDDAGDSDKNRGYVLEMWVEGTNLNALVEMIGQDAIEAAARNDVSIYSPPELVDGKGNKYVNPIQHLALTPEPVVPGLGAFIPIAASRKRAKAAKMSRGDTVLEFLNQIAEALKLSKFDDEAKAKEMILSRLKELAEKAEPKADDSTPEPSAEPKADETKPAESAAVAASRQVLARLLADNRNLKIDGLLRENKITPAMADKLRDQWIGKGNERVALALSRGDTDVFEQVIATLELAKPVVPTGEKTGAQVRSLSRDNGEPGKTENTLLAAVDRINERMFGVKNQTK